MTDWALIAGGHCKQAWRVGVAGFDTNTQQIFLLSEVDWSRLGDRVPLEPLVSYGQGNGLLFERLTDVQSTAQLDGLLLIACEYSGQVLVSPPSELRRYLVLLNAAERGNLEDEAVFAKLFLPAVVPFYDERQIYLSSYVLVDLTGSDAERWALHQGADEHDYSRHYHRSADWWIHRVTSAIAADAADVRNDGPLLSVIIPSYNYGRFLGQCVQSVLDQGVDDIEILVLDNASTDNTQQVMSAFADNPRVRYMRNRYNYGPGHNWRNGMWIAQGRYITFLSADDYFNSGHLARLLPTLEQHPHIAVGYTSIRWVDTHGQPLNQPRHPGYRNGNYVGGRNEVADLLIHDNYMAPSAVIYRRKAFCATWRPEKTYSAGDWEMVVQMAERYPDFAYVDVPGVSYRWHGGQESNRFYASSEPLAAHLAIVQGVFNRNAESCLKGREREVAGYINRRLTQYPQEQHSELGQQAYQLCERLETLARLSEDALFSIILTTYNRPGLLKDALASVGNQTLRDFEVILINDNGDPVEFLFDDYDFPITYIRQGRNRGLSAARNAGLKLAKGRYVLYLDDDDIYLPDHLAVLAEAFEQHPNRVVYTGVEYVSERLEDGQRIEVGRSQPFKHETFDRDRLFVQNYIPVNTWAHPREMLATVGEFDTGLAAFEDWDMLLRLATRYAFVHVPKVTSEVHIRVPGVGNDHMLGRERKNFPALYRELYGRYLGSSSAELQRNRQKMLESLGDKPPVRGLEHWLADRKPTPIEHHLINQYLQAHQGGPQIGIIVLDPDGQLDRLVATIESLSSERCFYTALKVIAFTTAEASGISAMDGLQLVQMTTEPLAVQINRVVDNSDFDWFMLARAGDEFTPSGLMIAGLELAANPECRAVYGDHLQKLSDGNLGGALLPSVNLDLLLSFPLVMARHWLYRRDVFLAAGGFDGDFAQAMEFELLTRLIEQEGLVGLGHIDELLLIAEAPTLRDNSDECRVIKRHLSHRGYQAQIQPGLPARYRIHYGHTAKPLVSILVATNVSLMLLQRCIDTLLEKTQYAHYELLLVDGDASPEVSAWLKQVASLEDNKLRVISADTARSAQSVAAERAKGEYLLMLSGETAIVEANWLDELLNHAQRPEVGIVGGKLLAPDGCIQQASLILGLNGPVGYPFVGEPINAAGYMNRLQVDQNCSAVAGACLMVRKALYEQVGGVDEKLFGATYSHVDLCLKVGALGYLSVWTPRAVLLHEGQVNQAKLNVVDPAAQEAMYSKWLPRLARDPAYNLNLSLTEPGGFRLADTSLSWRPLDSWRPLPVVLAHPADNTGCGHYRVIQPLNALKNAGLVDGSLQRNLLSVTELERYNPDTIILQRQIYPEQLETMRRMKAFSKAFRVYELDDYLPNIPLKSVHRQHMPKDVLKSLKRGISYSDRFVVSTEVLAEVFSNAHSDIRVVHNRLDPLVWENLVSLKRQSRKPRVGWAGGVGHTGDLEMIADVVKALSDEVDWVFFGMCPDKLRPYIKEFHLGVPIEDYPQKLASLNLDLALAPLEQNLFNECKSNLRLLEYGACAVPVICSDVRCYAGDLPVTRVKNRFRDWIEAVRTHLADLDEAARQGSALQAMVQRDWMLKGERLASWQKAWLA